MRFVQYWMSRAMEDADELAAKWQEHMNKVQDGADVVRDRWTKYGIQTNGSWTFADKTSNHRERMAEAEASPVSVYANALKQMDEKERRDKQAQKN